MAVRTAAITSVVGGTMKATWTGLLNGDTGSLLTAPEHTFKEVQVFGTFGAGGNVSIDGSLNDGTNFAPLNDPQGNALATVTAARIERIQESTASVRPSVTAGDGTTNLTVIIILKTQTEHGG